MKQELPIVINMVCNNRYYELLQFDELHDLLRGKSELFLSYLDELPIKFKPTYKFYKGSLEYDTSTKVQPAWYDRILFRKSSTMQIKGYYSNEVYYSEHLPVSCNGLINVTLNEVQILSAIPSQHLSSKELSDCGVYIGSVVDSSDKGREYITIDNKSVQYDEEYLTKIAQTKPAPKSSFIKVPSDEAIKSKLDKHKEIYAMTYQNQRPYSEGRISEEDLPNLDIS
jgi:hypothetical protein